MKKIILIKKSLWILCLTVMFASPSYGGPETNIETNIETNGHDNPNITVVELFTSQGCNSCPPADEILANLAKEDNVLALSYSVDYWNYMGWEDTLAQPDCSLRQRNYNKALGKSGVYTPQMIIQGRFDIIGSRGELVRGTLAKAKNLEQYPPSLSFTARGDNILIEIGSIGGKKKSQATIWLIGYDYTKTVNIKGGELNGQMRTYHNVVQSIKKIGHWTGGDMKIDLLPSDIDLGKHDDYAVLLQHFDTGPIITAAKLQ